MVSPFSIGVALAMATCGACILGGCVVVCVVCVFVRADAMQGPCPLPGLPYMPYLQSMCTRTHFDTFDTFHLPHCQVLPRAVRRTM